MLRPGSVYGGNSGSCTKCGEPVYVTEGACRAMGHLFHNTCFTCSICSKQLKGQPFFTVSGHVYCEDDFLFSGVHPSEEVCNSCGCSITDLTGAAGSALRCGLRLQGLLHHRLSQGPVSSLLCLHKADTPNTDSIPWSMALKDSSVLWSLVVDLSLLALFTAQHSLLAWSPVKQALQSVTGALNRTAYCFTTALALQIMMRYWQPVTGAPCLWSVRHAPWSIWFPLLCFSLHFLCWAIICSILVIFDYPELLGIKQVYYKCLGMGDPFSQKPLPAQRLLSHLRHPVCLELVVILWLLPALSLDRLLLAGTLSAYLALAHSLDKQDLAYLCARLKDKVQLFAEPQQGSVEQNGRNHKEKGG
ncbi:PREDICTED: nurim isoform X1 [Cyprinodon variegatus]|uniref:nurim isoform X1 n=1 Tax=Cyprinodon variegatus TaxID=28743 RepID=UPI0007427DB8|nr:PREDICTED: nurim isoform X1 [Cyprinodon variegatus]